MLHEIGYSVRSLLRTPAITAAAVLTLAMTLGATCALLMLVSAVIWRPLPIEDQDRVFVLHQQNADRLQRTFTFASYERLQHQLRDSVAGMSASGTRAVRLTVADHTENGTAVFAGAGYFTVVGLRPAVGRMFSPADHAPGAEATAVITDTLWRTRFGASPNAIGSRLRLNGKPVLIIGVAPRSFNGMRLTAPADIFVPLEAAPALLPPGNFFGAGRIVIAGRGYSPQAWLEIIARLRPGTDAKTAEASASAAVSPPSSATDASSVRFVPSADAALPPLVQQATAQFTSYLGAIVAAIWLIGCATLAALMISRNDLRQRELAVRAALGASRWAVARLVLWDVALISGAAACGAWALAHVIVGSLESFALPGGIRISRLHFDDARAAVAAAALAGLATLVSAGILPVLLSRQRDVAAELKAANGRATGHTRAKAMLVVAQVAVSCILLVGAGLFIRSVQAVNGMDVGPDVKQLVYATVNYSGDPAQPAALTGAVSAAVASVRELPGVQSVTYGGLPLVSDGGSNQVFTVDGAERVLPDTMIFDCGADYFATVGIPLLEGRDFTAADASDAPRVVIVNESLARLLWGQRSALGRRVTFLPHEQPLEVIGVARDGKYVSIGEDTRLALYQPWSARGAGAGPPALLMARLRGGDIETRAGALRGAIQGASADLIPTATSSMRRRIADLTVVQRFGATVAGWLGGAALILATAGVFGLVGSSVTRRRREIGIRLALGGDRRALVRMLMLTAVRPVAAGIILGLTGAVGLARFAGAFLLGITPADVTTYAVVVAALTVVALATSYTAARRVRSIDVGELMRAE
jgi:predicted permease